MALRQTARKFVAFHPIRRITMILFLLVIAVVAASGRQSGAQSAAPQAATQTSAPTVPPPASINAPSPTMAPQSAQPQLSPDIYNQSFKALFVLFVLAVIIESGLAVVFNWRPFVESFDSRSVKPLVAFAFCWLFVEAFDLDIATRLVNVYSSTNYPINLPGKILTALVLAGGSSGVNNIMTSLGFRPASSSAPPTPRPPPNEAWIAVRLARRQAKGPVTVRLGDPAAALPVAGMIAGTAVLGGGVISYFLRDRGRFPSAGGYRIMVPAGGTTPIRVELEGQNAAGAPVAAAAGSSWGPYPIAAGAIIDLELSL